MFVMLSVHTSAVCERKAEPGPELTFKQQQQQPPQKQTTATTPTILIDHLLTGSTCLIGTPDTEPASSPTPSPPPPPPAVDTLASRQHLILNNLTTINNLNNTVETGPNPGRPFQHQTQLIEDIYANTNSSSLIEKTFVKSISFDKNLNTNTLLLTELNNFKHPPAVQAPVATILNDLSPIPVPTKVTNQKAQIPPSHMTPKGLQDNTPDVKAMRYYRLWIYTCNAVLLMAVIVFCGVAGKVLMADYKRLLVGGLNLGQPSFIYAYLALLVQSGFLQLIGCLGALRLSERLLNAYWMLLLTLLLGDVVIGVFWFFKFERMIGELQPTLRHRLATEYGVMADFTELWDRLQSETRCCGIVGQDFQSTTNRSYPASCCAPDLSEQISISRRPLASAVVFRSDDIASLSGSVAAHHQKPNFSDIADMASSWGHAVTESRGTGDEMAKTIAMCRVVFPTGCAERLAAWMKSTADILFVLGYCVIAFLKLSFLGILRYEIKEMIQKIKLLQTELATSILGVPEVEQQQNCVLLQIPSTTVNNGGVHTEPKVGNRDRERNRIGSGESERESLLLHETTPKYLRTQRSMHAASEQGEDASDAAKSINGNNNYELTEFDTKAPTYRLLNAPTVTKI